MPELPEVETIKRDLEKIILGEKFVKICVHQAGVIRQPSAKLFSQGLVGLRVKNILRRGKLLIFELSNGQALTIHLKMTGQLVYPGGSSKSRVAFYFTGGKILDFNDQRLFGELRLVDRWETLKFVQELGPEPFDLTCRVFQDMLLKKKTAIKPLLLDQKFISGIGNIYAAEILYRAKINPLRSSKTLLQNEVETLFCQTIAVLKMAIKCGGSSVDDYVRVSGENGDYARHHQVYGRQGRPCFVCKNLIQRITQGSRGTYFCPHCQR